MSKPRPEPPLSTAIQLRLALLHLTNAISLGDRLERAHKSRRRSLKLKLGEEIEGLAALLEAVIVEEG